ncbi:PREDICTED: CASP-like protein 4A4 isoform X2 [Nicotiana attenuata]|uniref:CASP-like protein n=1 Tax=Nicotiana attenuata TaxID=49451 RepID=A0A314L6F7_NICAT|nr:PREDICTED: CASP-like protein 4A4 isoform X2 [Nicotiana attenuata]OIT37135.1 casp-like protein 4a4 [Nicotiana attenuata]
MKEGNVLMIAQRMVSDASPSSTPRSPATQPPLPTPSPYSFSVASTRLSSRPSIHTYDLTLRSLALLFSFISALSLAAQEGTKKKQISSFYDHPELTYCFTVSILVFIYSAFQLFKRVCDIAYRGVLILDMTSDYLSFIFDQLAGYLLLSSSSVTIPVIQQMNSQSSLWKAAAVADCMSFSAFMVIAVSALLSGYKLCKRIIW